MQWATAPAWEGSPGAWEPVDPGARCARTENSRENDEPKEETITMRRITTALTAATAALALAACNGDTTEDTTTPADTTPAVDTTTDEGTETGAAGADDEATQTDDAATTDDAAMTDDAAAGTAGAAGAGMTDEVCAEFFETQGTPLSERVPEQLDVVSAGDDLDPASFSEVSLLEGRIDGLMEDASGDQQGLLERINAPFTEVVEAVVGEDQQLESEIAIPEVDVEDSEAALEEFEASCS